MRSEYSPIDSSEDGKDAKFSRKTCSANLLAFLFIMLIASFIFAVIIIQLVYRNDGSVIINADVRSFPARTGVFRLPIGGSFNCSRDALEPRKISPVDANRVRPADIKYVAAMGDSYTTAFLSYTAKTEAVDEMRNAVGNSFVMGGDGTLEEHLTLANILRHLNPSLVGYSTGQGLAEAETNLNVAWPAKWVNDMQRQARELIRRLGKYSPISLRDEWKLITIFIGTRDITGFCHGEGGSTKLEYKRNLTEAIEILQEALPKSIISIIGMTNLDFMWRAPTILTGEAMPCLIDNFELLAQRRIEQYREAIVEIVADFSENSRRDQVVIAQHIFDDLWEPLRKLDGSFLTDFYSTDSFHLSNYGNSLVAKQLWSHLISPDYRKLTNNEMMGDESPILLCPEENCPFIRTPSNSIDCSGSLPSDEL